MTSSQRPRVSVVVPCFDSASYVGQTIATIRAQSLTDWECVVMDDGSTDGSAAVAAEAAEGDPRVRVLSQANGGVACARNAGFEHCDPRSEYVLFFDADDCLEASMLEEMTAHLDAHPRVGLVHCRPTFIDEHGRPLPPSAESWTPRYVPSRWGIRELEDSEPETPFVSIFALAGIVPSLVVFRRSAYELTPGWDESFGHIFEDTNLFLRVALVSDVHFVPRTLVRHRRHPSQSTSDAAGKLASQQRKLYEQWADPAGLTDSQRATVRGAWRFLERRVVPVEAAAAARRHLRERRPHQAALFLGGAATVALKSYLSRPGARASERQRPSSSPREAS